MLDEFIVYLLIHGLLLFEFCVRFLMCSIHVNTNFISSHLIETIVLLYALIGSSMFYV